MKKLMMSWMMVLMCTVMFAQRSHHDPAKMAQWQTDRLKNALALNDEQYATIKGINERYANKISELRKDSVKSNRRTEMQTLLEQKQTEINNVLTPEQQTKFKNIQADQQAKRAINRSGKGNQHREELKKTLSLTDDQQTKMEAANKTFMENVKKVKSDTTLSKDESRTRIKALRNDHDAEVKNILSADQYAKWEAYKADMKNGHGHGRHNAR